MLPAQKNTTTLRNTADVYSLKNAFAFIKQTDQVKKYLAKQTL